MRQAGTQAAGDAGRNAAPILLGGREVDGEGAPLTLVNPADGSIVAVAGTASAQQVAAAVRAGHASLARTRWASIEPHLRAAVLYRIADAIGRDVDRLARLQVRENGKTLTESREQAKSAAAIVRYYAAVCETLGEEAPPARGPYIALTVYEPVGVVAAITPWNSPLTMAAQKIAPALAAGNAVVLKPAEITSLVSLEFGRICMEAGLPEGLLSVLPGGFETGNALVSDPAVGMISFTGGTDTGRAIAAVAARRFAPVILELGGKSPHIVFADADLDRAAVAVSNGIFGSGGQSCVAGSRLFVEASVADLFRSKLIAAASRIVVGHPNEPASSIGPLASFAHRDRIEAIVEAAVEAGGRIALGGKRLEGGIFEGGAYYSPTIVDGIDNRSGIAQQEIFGPVLCFMTFDDEVSLVADANDSAFGLACGIWTSDYRRAWRVARAMQAGSVWINTYKQLSIASPFGGFKDSGLGREKGIQGLRAYQQAKSIYLGLD